MKEFVVVTGGAGFIGSHTVGKLLESGCQVAVLDNFRTGKRENLASYKDNPSLFIYEIDIVDGLWPILTKITQKHGDIDRVIHLAAQTSVITSIANPVDDIRINYSATVQLLEYARTHHIKKVVFASTAAVYGDVKSESVSEELRPRPMSPYGINKLSSELHLDYYYRIHGLPTTAFRFFNVYGPRQDPLSSYSGVVSIFIERALNHEELVIFGSGEQTRDFVYVEDIARVLAQCCCSDRGNGMVMNVGTEKTITINELASKVVDGCDSKSIIRRVKSRTGEIFHSRASTERVKSIMGFKPQFPLEEGLKRTIAWAKSEKSIP